MEFLPIHSYRSVDVVIVFYGWAEVMCIISLISIDLEKNILFT